MINQAVVPKQFGEISGPHSEGGSYATYHCSVCNHDFYGGNGTCTDPEGDYCIQCPYCTTMDPSYQEMWEDFKVSWEPDNIIIAPEIGLQSYYNPPREPASDPQYIKHVRCEDARFHKLFWNSDGTHCSEKDCIVNKRT